MTTERRFKRRGALCERVVWSHRQNKSHGVRVVCRYMKEHLPEWPIEHGEEVREGTRCEHARTDV